MKEQVAISLAGLMLFTAGCENAKDKAPFSAFAGMQGSKSQKPTTQDVGEQNVHHQWQGKSGPSLYDGGLFVRADFLYWRANEEGLEYGLSETINAADPKISTRVVSPKVRWNPAFRVGMGYTFGSQDFWDISALWTRFSTDQNGSKNGTVLPWWGSTLLGNVTTHARAKWKLIYNTYDLDLGRNYFIARTVSVHPFVGLRGATIHQDYHANYATLQPLESATSFHAKNQFWGVGAHIGSGLQWYMNSSLSLVGNIGGSLLYGDFRIKERYNAFIPINSNVVTQVVPLSVREHITTGSFNVEALLGFQWERFFFKNKYRLAITAGYEWSEWFSQNRIKKFTQIPASNGGASTTDAMTDQKGDLTLQGANLQVRCDF